MIGFLPLAMRHDDGTTGKKSRVWGPFIRRHHLGSKSDFFRRPRRVRLLLWCCRWSSSLAFSDGGRVRVGRHVIAVFVFVFFIRICILATVVVFFFGDWRLQAVGFGALD